jgi:hypothetical protein
MMGDVIHLDFGQPDPASPDEESADVMSIVAELEPNHALLVLSNALFAVLLAKNGRDHNARWRDLREFHRGMRKLFLASQRIWPTA